MAVQERLGSIEVDPSSMEGVYYIPRAAEIPGLPTRAKDEIGYASDNATEIGCSYSELEAILEGRGKL